MMLRVMLLVFMLAWPWPAAAASFQDDSGQPITVTAPYQRIISLYGAHTENLFSLGAGDQVVGVSTSEDYPPEALTKPALSYRDDPERMLALRPDLVLVRPMIMRGRRGLVDSLRQAGVTVVSLQPRSAEGMFTYWQRLGLLTGRRERAEAMIARFRRELGLIRARVITVPERERPRVFFESIHRRMKTFAPDSIAAFALEVGRRRKLGGRGRGGAGHQHRGLRQGAHPVSCHGDGRVPGPGGRHESGEPGRHPEGAWFPSPEGRAAGQGAFDRRAVGLPPHPAVAARHPSSSRPCCIPKWSWTSPTLNDHHDPGALQPAHAAGGDPG